MPSHWLNLTHALAFKCTSLTSKYCRFFLHFLVLLFFCFLCVCICCTLWGKLFKKFLKLQRSSSVHLTSFLVPCLQPSFQITIHQHFLLTAHSDASRHSTQVGSLLSKKKINQFKMKYLILPLVFHLMWNQCWVRPWRQPRVNLFTSVWNWI